MRVLLTNDDGIGATGLHVLRKALLRVPDIELAVIAPDSNRSARRAASPRARPLWVEEVDLEDGDHRPTPPTAPRSTACASPRWG